MNENQIESSSMIDKPNHQKRTKNETWPCQWNKPYRAYGTLQLNPVQFAMNHLLNAMVVKKQNNMKIYEV